MTNEIARPEILGTWSMSKKESELGRKNLELMTKLTVATEALEKIVTNGPCSCLGEGYDCDDNCAVPTAQSALKEINGDT